MVEHKGTLYGVSVGPGDPELMTLQAVRRLQMCPVIAAPQTKSGQMLALEIAQGAVDLSEKTIVPLQFPMRRFSKLRMQRRLSPCGVIWMRVRMWLYSIWGMFPFMQPLDICSNSCSLWDIRL